MRPADRDRVLRDFRRGATWFLAVSESIAGRRPARDIFELLCLAQIELVFHDS